MESAKIISYISLGVSSITVIFGFFVFLKYDRRLKNQEKRLNKKLDVIYDSQIDKIKKEELNKNIADLFVVALPYNGGGSHDVRISNIGKCKARNIRLGENSLTKDNGIFENTFETISGLDPMGRADFRLHCSNNVKSCFSLTLIWDDEMNKDNSKEFSINL